MLGGILLQTLKNTEAIFYEKISSYSFGFEHGFLPDRL